MPLVLNGYRCFTFGPTLLVTFSITRFGLQAPGEAEAELAYLNQAGVIDGILSDDVDNFLFGALTVIRK